MPASVIQRFLALDRRRRIQVLATSAAALLVLVASVVVLTGWAAGPTVGDYLADSGIATQRTLRIGISGIGPSLSYGTDKTSTALADYEGFDIEISRSLAKYLGFDPESVRVVRTQAQNRPLLLNQHVVDIVVASYSMTDKREAEDVDFAGPYLLTSPEMLMRAPGAPRQMPMNKLRDFAGKLCTTGGSTSEDTLHARQIPDVDGQPTAADCVDGLLRGTYDAVVLDEAILAGYKNQHGSDLALVDLVLQQTERYGIAVANHSEKLRTVICNFLFDSYERKSNGAWQRAWNKTLGRVLTEQRQPRPDNCPRLRDYRDRIDAGGPIAGTARLPGAAGELATRPAGNRHPGTARRRSPAGYRQRRRGRR
jgi:glutamate transport system substrate-binding protein